MQNNYIKEESKNIPISGVFDVVVVGGGLTGVMAAVSAARNGLKTILVEKQAYFGGVGVMGLPLQGFYDLDNNQIIKGLPDEFISRLRACNGASSGFIQCEMHNPFLVVDPEMVKLVCQQMLIEADVTLLLHTFATGIIIESSIIKGVFIENKSGRQCILGSVFIDCSGDGDIAKAAGVPYTFGREVDGQSQASTLMFRLDNVDIKALISKILEKPDEYDLIPTLPRIQFSYNKQHILVGLGKFIAKARKDGMHAIPWDRVCYITCLHEGSVMINMVHVENMNATDGLQLTRIELEGRAQIGPIHQFLKHYVTGFEQSTLAFSAPCSGIRETRHIQGEYVLTEDDILGGVMPKDTVVVGGYPIDIHYSSPDADSALEFEHVSPYGIPYRCMLPKEVDNLLIAGRCISATHRALASLRVMGTCMGLGQAAGLAAVLSKDSNWQPRKVSATSLRRRLLDVGAYVNDENTV